MPKGKKNEETTEKKAKLGEQVTNVDDFLVAPARQEHFRFRIEGTEPMKMDLMSQETIVKALIRKEREQPDTTSPLEDMAAKSLYRDEEGDVAMRVLNVLSCLRDAGTRIPWGATGSKIRVTRGSDGKTMLYSFLKVHGSVLKNGKPSEYIKLIDLKDGGENNEGWEVDISLGKMPNGTAVGIVRPKFEKWALEFDVTITYVGPEVTPKMIGQLFNTAGMSYGLGSHRPSCGGPYGTFKLVKVEKIDAPAASKAA